MTASPLTLADLREGVLTDADLVAGQVTLADLRAGVLTLAKLEAAPVVCLCDEHVCQECRAEHQAGGQSGIVIHLHGEHQGTASITGLGDAQGDGLDVGARGEPEDVGLAEPEIGRHAAHRGRRHGLGQD